jgi:hypothetical protein
VFHVEHNIELVMDFVVSLKHRFRHKHQASDLYLNSRLLVQFTLKGRGCPFAKLHVAAGQVEVPTIVVPTSEDAAPSPHQTSGNDFNGFPQARSNLHADSSIGIIYTGSIYG